MNPHLKDCEEFPLDCPNGCSREGEDGVREVKRKDIPVHLDNHCPLQKVQCPYWDHGCREEMARRHTDTHEREFLHIHFKLSLTEIKLKQIESTQVTQRLQHNLDTANEKITFLEESLKLSRAELNAATERITILEKHNSDKNPQFVSSITSIYPQPVQDARSLFGTTHEDRDESGEYHPDHNFKPIVSLPEIKDFRTEEEEILFKSYAYLYRYVVKEWKEKGRGELKIHQINKLCCNHFITPDITLKPFERSENSWMWYTNADFSEEEHRPKTLVVRFKHKDDSNLFKEIFDRASASKLYILCKAM